MSDPTSDLTFNLEMLALLLMSAIALFSSILMLILYMLCKPLQAHPGQLLLLTSAFEASAFYFFLLKSLRPFDSPYDLEAVIIQITAFVLPTSLNWDKEEICIVQNTMFHMSVLGIFVYCFFLALDLVFIIQNPFYSPAKRRRRYHLIFIFMFLTPLLFIFAFRAHIICYNKISLYESTLRTLTVTMEIIILILIVMVVSAQTISLYMAGKRLGFGWFSRKDKQVVFLKKHVYYAVLFFFGFIVQLVFQSLILAAKFTDYFREQTIRQWMLVNEIAILFPGVCLLPLRMREPYIFQFFKYKFSKIFLKVKCKLSANRKSCALNRKIEESNSYFSVLHTSLNAQLVDILLKGLLSIYGSKRRTGMIAPMSELTSIQRSDSYPKQITLDPKRMGRDSINSSMMNIGDEDSANITGLFGDSPNKHIKEQITIYGDDILDQVIKFDGITPDEIVEGLDPILNSESIFKASLGEGKSGSFFFFSTNSRFIIKTLTRADALSLLNILPKYAEHFRENAHSLLSRIYCLFSVKVTGVVRLYGILMQNTLPKSTGMELECVFDLKGSMINRYKEVLHSDIMNKSTLLDINFLKLDRAFNLVDMKTADKKQLSNQILRDSGFLALQKCLDYSMLLGVYKTTKHIGKENILSTIWPEQRRNGWVSKSGKRTYTFKKKMEHFVKSKILYPNHSDNVTVIPPYKYYKRFYKFMSGRVIKE